ncbi:MAG: amidophosphoribosyltransferase [Bdellovibrionales bacterium]
MSWQDKCAVFGIWNHLESSLLTYLGLYALQHRGQEGAGIVSLDKGRHKSFKDVGLVGDIFSSEKLKNLTGLASIGHTRYSTTGSEDLKNIQPLTGMTPFGSISISHNGNIVNHHLLKKTNSTSFETGSSDTESILSLLKNSKESSIEKALKADLPKLEGAYSLAVLTENSLIAVRDPMGFRPLVLGKKGDSYMVASETCAFDLIGAEYLREVNPGEILIINDKGLKSEKLPSAPRLAKCIFEHVYFSRPDSLVFGQNVYECRKKMGEYLAEEHPVDADLVIPVPDSGIPAAIGYSKKSGIPYEMGIIRNHYIGRTFIHPSDSIRNFKIKIKLNPQKHLVKNKRIIAVDDSIVRGATSKALIEVLRQAGAKEVHLRVSSPPIKGPCYYGVDTPLKKQLIGANKKIEDVKNFLKADSLAYLSYENLIKASGGGKKNYCLACFDEKYPTPIYER